MSLILCSECGTEVSDKAPFCPKCGQPNPQNSSIRPAKSGCAGATLLVVMLIVLAAGGGVIWYITAQQEAAAAAERARVAAIEHQREVEEAAEAARLRAEQEARAREAARRLAATSDPTTVLDLLDSRVYDEGILNDYRTLTKIRLMNRSAYPLRRLSGEVRWFKTSGTYLGSSPFRLSGSIPAGATATFSTRDGTLSCGTIQGNAHRFELRFNAAEIVE